MVIRMKVKEVLRFDVAQKRLANFKVGNFSISAALFKIKVEPV